MKKLIIVLGILVAANVLVAQDSEPNERGEIRRKEIKDRLELTDEQSSQLQELREKYRPEVRGIRGDESKTRSERLRAVADLVDQKNTDLQGILSQTQITELSVIRKEIHGKRREHREQMRKRMNQRRSRKK